MKKLISLLWVILISSFMLVNAQTLDTPINKDPNVKIGKLENGITYYIRANKKPEKRIEFRLAVNAGSNQENDNQQGLAHFTEHMAFNGIKGFPSNELVSELQKIGVAFGADLNAYTSFDETVYMIKMPTDDPKYVQMGLNILYGWANGLLYDNEEIDKERGIIVEEYRMGLGASDRMQKKWFPVLFTNSRYADRLPIGKLEILQNFKYQTIKDFYKDWYRTDLQAIVVVGDLDPAAMEQQIINTFGKIKPVKNGREKIEFPIEGNKEPLVAVCTDKEAMGSQVMLVRKFPHFTMKTVGDFKTHMAQELFNLMINSRLSEILQDSKTPFVAAYCGYSDLVGSVDCYMSQASSKENKITDAIRTLMRENYRVLKFGFLESELKRAKEELLNQYDIAVKEIDKTESEDFAAEYVANFLHQDPIPGAKRELAFANKYLEQITLSEVNDLAKKWITQDNFVAVVLAPEKEGVVVPTEAEVLSIIKDPSLQDVTPYVDTYKEQNIVEKNLLNPGKIIEVKEIPEIGTKELTLSNGIKVYVKKTDFKNDEILFSAQSKGGMSLYEVSDLASASFASQMVDRAGIGELNYSSLEKKLKGKKLGLTPYIGSIEEGLSGSSTPKDLDLFFQYLNAFFTNPRYDTSVYKIVIDENMEQVKMLKVNPMYKFFGEFIGLLSQNDPYQATLLNYTEDFVSSANYEKAFQIYKQRFANPADFLFSFVGNFSEDTLNYLIETYIASLPTSIERENFKGDVLKQFPASLINNSLYFGAAEQSWVGLGFNKEYPWTLENNMIVNQIEEALQIELIETIREKMSGVYSPMLQMVSEKYPRSTYTTLVMFSCAPDNTDNLANAVTDILKGFQKTGPKPETLDKVKKQLITTNQTDVKTNKFWNSYIIGKYYYGDDVNAINSYEKRVNAVTNEDIVKFMNAYFTPDQFVRLTLFPEAMKK